VVGVVQHRVVPRLADELEHLAHLLLGVGHELLVADLEVAVRPDLRRELLAHADVAGHFSMARSPLM
jgi:hypothetical protein